MVSLLIAIIYLAFISLGLPDSLLGSGWHIIQIDMGVPLSYAGIISATITCGTIISSVCSNWLIKKLRSGLLTAISVIMTAVALFGFSVSTKFVHLVLWAIPYGLGAGAVDATLNNYAALNFSSKHMNWLHAFWGLGALISPFIMATCLQGASGWQGGYRTVFFLQFALSVILFASLPLWKKNTPEEKQCNVKTVDALKTKGVWLVLVMFFCYCATEQTAMLWASSYLAQYRGVDNVLSTEFGSLFFIGITLGRFACGFFSNKLGDNKLIVIGICTIIVGLILVALPLPVIFCFVGLVLVGLGCAPVYPAIIHSTPKNFGEQNSQAIVGVQMAFAYAGSMIVPLLFGAIFQNNLQFLPYYLALFTLVMTVMFVLLNKSLSKNLSTNNQNISSKE